MYLKRLAKLATLTTALTSASLLYAGPSYGDIWQDIDISAYAAKSLPQTAENMVQSIPSSRKIQASLNELEMSLAQAPLDNLGYSNVAIDLPLPDGEMANFTLSKDPIFAPRLAAKYSNIQTYKIKDPKNEQNRGRLSLTPSGFRAIIDYEGQTILIDPLGYDDLYQSYYKQDYIDHAGHERDPFICMNADHVHQPDEMLYSKSAFPLAANISLGSQIRTYRLAVATTGEYTNFHGGTTGALDAIAVSLNRINQVFERDVAVRFELIGNNDDIIYTNANTDPFTNNNAQELVDESVTTINAEIGSANYDIGHVFSTNGGGLAAVGAVCATNFKAQGTSGFAEPVGDIFDIDLLAHELGHQMGADHSFNGTTGNCGGANRSTLDAYEPGSGSTIMAYAGICGSENIQSLADDYFHTHSIEQMRDVIDDGAAGGACGTLLTGSNAVPLVNSGSAIEQYIPISTPFMLTGSATDADGDTLSYIWEQLDRGLSTSGSADFDGTNNGPIFRSFPPISEPTRIFPQLSDILSGTETYGEVLPTIARNLKFRLTVRDGNGGVASDERNIVVVDTAGPFTASTPSGEVLGGQSNTVNWNVAGTTSAPLSCDTVNIDLSTNGGNTFTVNLGTDIPNNGIADLVFPNIDTTSARLRISCASQPFFAITASNFDIESTVTPNNPPALNADSYTVTENSAATLLDVLANDSDPDDDVLTITAIGTPANGASVSISNNQISFQPAANFTGLESFSYTVSDGTATRSSTVQVTVEAEGAINANPLATNDSFTVPQDSSATSFDVLDNDSDADGDTLSLSLVGAPNNGGSASIVSGQISYQPAATFNGTETFNYTISDGNGGSDTATVTVTVTPAPNNEPVATNDTFTITENSNARLINVLANDTDADGDTLSLTNVSAPSRGSIAFIQGSSISYEPNANITGGETFTYTVSDGNGGTDTATVTVTITAQTNGGGSGGSGSSGGGGGCSYIGYGAPMDPTLPLSLIFAMGYVAYRRRRQAH